MPKSLKVEHSHQYSSNIYCPWEWKQRMYIRHKRAAAYSQNIKENHRKTRDQVGLPLNLYFFKYNISGIWTYIASNKTEEWITKQLILVCCFLVTSVFEIHPFACRQLITSSYINSSFVLVFQTLCWQDIFISCHCK